MLLVDDILLSPLLFIFQEIGKAAEEASAGEGEALRTELTELYMMLETRAITEEEFNVREKKLLDQLERFESRNTRSEVESESGGG